MDTPVTRNSKGHPGIKPGKRPGTYRINYYDWDKTRRTKIFTGSLSDAVILRRALLAKADRIRNGLESPPEKIEKPQRFFELWDYFQKDYQLKVDSGSIEKSSLDRYKYSVNALFDFQANLENKLLSAYRWQDFEQFKVYRQKLGFSPVGINTILRNIRTIFKYAVDNGYLSKNVLKDVVNIKSKKKDVRYLEERELAKLFEYLNTIDIKIIFNRDAHDLVLFYLYTGARTSEILYPDFTWDCIKKNEIVFSKTKSYKERKIPLTQNTRRILTGRKKIIGGPFFNEFNFDTRNCGRSKISNLTRDMVYNRTKSVFDTLGMNGISTRNLRKTAGAYYYMATRDIFATSKFLGHSTVRVTETHYSGLIQSLKSEYTRQFERLLDNSR